MRLLLFIFLSFSAFHAMYAQGSLQFNRVVTHTGTATGSWSYVSPSWTVPAGKVWKITAAYPTTGNAVNRNLEMDAGGGWASLALNNFNPAPIWLKAGDVVRLSASGNCCSVSSFSYLFSAIEFNIIP
jgi:hypothetical protein